jgi:hypothetical protein
MAVLRVCVRNGFGRELSDDLVEDLRQSIKRLEARGGGAPPQPSFHH